LPPFEDEDRGVPPFTESRFRDPSFGQPVGDISIDKSVTLDDLPPLPPSPRMRKRVKIVVDKRIEIGSASMKKRLENPNFAIRELGLAPESAEAIARRQREIDGVETYFAQSTTTGLPSILSNLITRNMTTEQPKYLMPKPAETSSEEVSVAGRSEPSLGQEQLDDALPGPDIESSFEEGDKIPSRVTYEQELQPEEEGRYVWRETLLATFLKNQFKLRKTDTLDFYDMVEEIRKVQNMTARKSAVSTLSVLLSLNSKRVIQLEQDAPFENLRVKKLAKLESDGAFG